MEISLKQGMGDDLFDLYFSLIHENLDPEFSQKKSVEFAWSTSTTDQTNASFSEFRKLLNDKLLIVPIAVPDFMYAYKSHLHNIDKVSALSNIFSVVEMVWWDDEQRRYSTKE